MSTSEEDEVGGTGVLGVFACGGGGCVVVEVCDDDPKRPPSINIKSSSLRTFENRLSAMVSSSQLPERRYKRPESLSLEGVLRSNR